MAKAKGK